MNQDANRCQAAQALIDATLAVAGTGQPLMLRVAPEDGQFVVWSHYPPDDAVDGESGARWFYHAHPPGEREAGEHGHFHLFFDKARLAARGAVPVGQPVHGASSGADVVHIAAIAIGIDGVPTELLTVNRWVTDEWLYPAVDIIAELDAFDLSAATGDPLVNLWLTTAMHFYRPEIAAVLVARDRAIADWPDGAAGFEDRGREVLSRAPIDINDAVRALGRDASSPRARSPAACLPDAGWSAATIETIGERHFRAPHSVANSDGEEKRNVLHRPRFRD